MRFSSSQLHSDFSRAWISSVSLSVLSVCRPDWLYSWVVPASVVQISIFLVSFCFVLRSLAGVRHSVLDLATAGSCFVRSPLERRSVLCLPPAIDAQLLVWFMHLDSSAQGSHFSSRTFRFSAGSLLWSRIPALARHGSSFPAGDSFFLPLYLVHRSPPHFVCAGLRFLHVLEFTPPARFSF
jgi:hypothetical protein